MPDAKNVNPYVVQRNQEVWVRCGPTGDRGVNERRKNPTLSFRFKERKIKLFYTLKWIAGQLPQLRKDKET